MRRNDIVCDHCKSVICNLDVDAKGKGVSLKIGPGCKRSNIRMGSYHFCNFDHLIAWLKGKESGGLVYLATPYNHEDPSIRDQRFKGVNKLAAKLMSEGVNIFSPISHTHPIALAGDLPKGWDFWEKYDRVMLAACTKVIVLKQSGWQESIGVQAEVEIAKEMGLPIEYVDP